MLCKDIMKQIEQSYPGNYAMEWDNVGLLVGNEEKEVSKIYVALDATDEVIQHAITWKADMLITHHPLIFKGMKRVTSADFIGARIMKLIQNDISYFAMHTNYDVLGMAELSGNIMGFEHAEVLEVTAEDNPQGDGTPEGIGRVADLKNAITLRECCEKVKEQFRLENVKVFGDLDQKVNRAAISPGSGKSMIGAALNKSADVLITGDIDHHEGIDAVAQGLAIIDAGHYGVEHIFIDDMRKYLENQFKDIEIQTESIHHPFQIV